MCRNQNRLLDHVFDHHPLFGGGAGSSFHGLTRHHQHERSDDENKFQVTIDVPGVDEKNIDIELKEEQGQTLLLLLLTARMQAPVKVTALTARMEAPVKATKATTMRQ